MESVLVPDGGSQPLNRYTYCLNNPLKFTDPSGSSPDAWSVGDISAMLSNPYHQPYENLPNDYVIQGVGDLMRFPEGRMAVAMFLAGGASALSSYMVGGPTIAQAFENGFFQDGDFKFGFNYLTVDEVKKPFETKKYLEFSEQKFRALAVKAYDIAVTEMVSFGAGEGLGILVRSLRRAGAGAEAWNWLSPTVKLANGAASYDDALKAAPEIFRSWNEFQRGTRGAFASRRAAAEAWHTYKAEYRTIASGVRSSASRTTFLKDLAASGNTPKWMNQWLPKGRVPPGYVVDHRIPLSVGGGDVPGNMRLLDGAFHDLHHSTGFYRPWEVPRP